MSVAVHGGLRRFAPALVAALALTSGLGLVGSWIVNVREDKPRRTTMRYRVTSIRPGEERQARARD